MDTNQCHEQKRQKDDVKAIHLPEVQQVEEGTDPDRVERIFALGSDPLRTKVRHRQVAGKGGADCCQKGKHAGYPGQPAAMPPGPLEKCYPQVQCHREEEQLSAPEMETVHKMTDGIVVPPLRPKGSQDDPGENQEDEAREGYHAEEIGW